MRPIRLNTCSFCCIYLLNKLNNKNIECRHTSIKRCCTQVYIFLFNILLQKYWFESFSCFWSNLLSLAGFFLLNVLSKKYWFEVFSSFWSSFLLAAFSSKFLVLAVLAVNLSGNPKLRMRPIRFNTCNFCCSYLLNKLNNKNIECRHTSIKRCYAQVYIFLFNILLRKCWFESFSCFWSNLLSLAGFFLLNILSKKYWFEVFSSFWSSFLLAAFSLKFLVLAVVTVNLSGKSKTEAH